MFFLMICVNPIAFVMSLGFWLIFIPVIVSNVSSVVLYFNVLDPETGLVS